MLVVVTGALVIIQAARARHCDQDEVCDLKVRAHRNHHRLISRKKFMVRKSHACYYEPHSFVSVAMVEAGDRERCGLAGHRLVMFSFCNVLQRVGEGIFGNVEPFSSFVSQSPSQSC